MKTAEIARRYLDYFEKRGHTIVPSASLVSDDPALLFTVAGMVPFIPYLSGDVPAPYARAADNQKCIRTNDIEEVGKTPRHGTFFQMLGNWSFGDYFKKDAIRYAWELLTTPDEDGGLGFDPKDLWVTVYEEDDEAIQLWLEHSTLPEERIQRLGRDTNYWTTGLPGPAGPCSEIFFDRGPEYGVDGGPATDDDRYVEIWNLVFMQYEITNVRSKYEFDIFGDLPAQNIDTGMGLERVAFIKQGVDNMYETDQVRPVLDKAVELSGKRYGEHHDDDVRFRVVADHIRSSLMLLSDGVTPANDGRGYILRRLMRRAIRSMRLLGVDGPTFAELFAVSRDAMKEAYPIVETDYARLSQYALAEEATFLRTLASGSEILDTSIEAAKSSQSTSLSGSQAFLLHDTYGFPIDLTLEIAEEAGLSVDRASFDTLMKEQRDRAKADARSRKGQLADTSVYRDFRALGETVFTGYTDLETESRVLGILVDGAPADRASQGQIAEVITAETALYAESGGQVADKGVIVGPGYELEVLDVQKPVPGLISHTVEVTTGEVAVGHAATTVVDAANRRAAAQAHSATHLVHAALRDTLGRSATQAGSLNRAGYLRFDFSWGQALSPETRSEIEEIANTAVRDDLEVTTRVMSLDDAKAAGAMALFGEKYGDTVRMVDIGGPWSRELCAGTHVASSAQVGLINLVGESSVGASNRRVEALVGQDAFRELAAERAIVSQLTSGLKIPRDQLPARIAELQASLKAAEKKIAQFEAKALGERVPALAGSAERAGAHAVVAQSLGTVGSADDLRSLALQVRDRLGSDAAVVALGAEVNGRPVVIVATNDAARSAGAKAGALAKGAAAALGGGGGGRDDVAQGGGTDASALPAALLGVVDALRGAAA
ncbi:alanine--tRNA ligase [Microbacterium sp. EYE_5]|uniref:alanine--tRNA ligase n=1 Tax=unclassified Microbacterium TaxID=2609290 RepID=UPI002002EBB3|nr:MULTISPECIES: alanine--tRNA ligase [unclassified Microbacterium]MCK6080718.1 alanine--tRNA ligase [Microbacterium sp. EYE_382]MCK6085989.1 alanine--tRNA ligase [Microbacterium sp. EYE_384]MCK6124513.1 alanine--tRNA ligase [Microbacterium sp. EYE_80]MCK6127422.1 alanine--tRNA ligase [Microbacterium sp. EYE_79]MCK6141673.1 alanine--tRNA ligase [Microbacterium sp. EYE_39]